MRVKVIPVNIISITLKHYASEKVTGHFVFVSAGLCVSLFALINSCKPLNNQQLKGTAQFLFVWFAFLDKFDNHWYSQYIYTL